MNKLSTIKELKSFLLLWLSQTVSELGTAMTDYALVIWAYQKTGMASSVTMLAFCMFLPTILFRFIAGTYVDRRNKKRIMLTADLIAATGSLIVLGLHTGSMLEIWHLYLINIVLSFMNSFQESASFVAISLIVPQKHYARIGGLQGITGSIVSILAPALGSILLVAGGLRLVLICDLASFAVAFFVLLFLVKIPENARGNGENEPFLKSCRDGIGFLRENKALLHLTLFIAVVNLLAKLGNDGLLAPFVLGRSGNDQRVLGMVQVATSAGILIGSIVMTLLKPVKKKARLIFLACAFICFTEVVMSLSAHPAVWSISNFMGYTAAVIMGANLTVILREKVPVQMQGRVFSAHDTLKNCTNPVGLLLSGYLADYIFEPFMKTESPVQSVLSRFFGSGSGSGIAVLFFIVGITGVLLSITRMRKTVYLELDHSG
ncbi:MAG: MFS transporter [Clostridiales bacterium]|nr:MFS transporter [Clostridiales bacterium]